MIKRLFLLSFVLISLYSCGIVNPEPEVSENLEEKTRILEEKINNLNKLKQQAKLLKQQDKCIDINEVNIHILAFNKIKVDGIIDENIDNVDNLSEENNILDLEKFEENLILLQTYNNENKIYLGLFSELEFFESEGCFPNKNMVMLTSNNSKVNFYTDIFPIIKKYNIKYNLALNTANLRKIGRYEDFMTTPELLEIISSNNFDFLSNGVTGISLNIIENKEKLKHEICGSKNYLDNNFSYDTNAIIFPNGKYNDDIIFLANSCGYKYGILVEKINKNLEEENKASEKNGLIGNNKYKLKAYSVSKNFDFNKILN